MQPTPTCMLSPVDWDKIQRDMIIENLSGRIHEIWSNWYTYQKNNSTTENLGRWDIQSVTSYKDLSEEDKEKDREIIRKLLINII